jgi:hypothetical protein
MRTSPRDSDDGYSWYLFQQLSEPPQPFGELIAKTAASREKFGLAIDCPERVIGEAVSANYFSALKVASLRGRVFEPGGRQYFRRQPCGGSQPVILGRAVSV